MKTLTEIEKIILPADFDELVECLSGADGMTDRVVLFCDENLRFVLEEMKFANRNVKGSYGGGEELRKVYKKGFEAVYEAVVAFCKEKNIKVLKERVEYFYDEVK